MDFPLLERDEASTSAIPTSSQWKSAHNPFTAPKAGSPSLTAGKNELSEAEVKALRGQSYDLVLNGVEVGGGSIRIHSEVLQKRILEDFLGHDPETFAHLLQAFRVGAPPHGGIAFGMDRLLAIMCDAPRISDVIAFPKSSNGAELMTAAPSAVEAEQLLEYGLQVVNHPE